MELEELELGGGSERSAVALATVTLWAAVWETRGAAAWGAAAVALTLALGGPVARPAIAPAGIHILDCGACASSCCYCRGVLFWGWALGCCAGRGGEKRRISSKT